MGDNRRKRTYKEGGLQDGTCQVRNIKQPKIKNGSSEYLIT